MQPQRAKNLAFPMQFIHYDLAMTTMYIDESGYTGNDLYNPKQPHFVIASSLVGVLSDQLQQVSD
jgi:hypothetical protein